ncbi:hypothetical protein D3C72_1910680 [compost metagenome]
MAVHNIVDGIAIFLRRVELQLGTGCKGFWHIIQRNTILRAFWSCKAGFDFIHVQFQRASKYRFITRIAPHSLGFGIRFDQRDLFVAAPTQTHVFQGHTIDREKAAGCTIFRGHVSDCRAIGER